MGYSDFVWFLLAEEDKGAPSACSFWFRVLDTDGDGQVSLHEMAHFYAEQQATLTLPQPQPLTPTPTPTPTPTLTLTRRACARSRRRPWPLLTSCASCSTPSSRAVWPTCRGAAA